MPKTLEFLFDYGSPFSFLADSQLSAMAERTNAELVYRPISLGAVFKATGNRSPASVPAKGRYTGLELQRWAARYGIAFSGNAHFPIHTLRLMRGAVAAQQEGCFLPYHEAVFNAMWAKGENLGDETVLRDVLARAGCDAERLLVLALDDAVKARLRDMTDDAVERGVFGAPTFFVGDEMFWGNDSLRFLEECLVGRGS